MWRPEYAGQERRKYIRLDSVFPVEFRLVSLDGKRFLSDWLQGFSNNISKGGICLSVNNFPPDLAKYLKDKQAKVSLDIEIPLNRKPIPAQAVISWIRDVADEPNKYLIGLNYEEIDSRQGSRIMRYAWTKKLFSPIALSIIIILGLALVVNSIISAKLINGNKALVGQLVKILQESSIAKQKVKELSRERQDLQLEINALEVRIKTAEEERGRLETAKVSEMGEVNSLIEKLMQEKDSLQEQMISLQRQEGAITEDLLHLDKRKANLEKANLDKMYQWIKKRQNPRNGLVMSFQGDKNAPGWAFIYDQALAIEAYTYFADFERAKKVLNFFKRKSQKEGTLFLNAYYINDGTPAQQMVYAEANIHLGIAILQYTKKSRDSRYLGMAEWIAERIIVLQNQDKEGGVRGEPNIEWFAMERNLNACVFFNLLYKVTAKPQYLQARDKLLGWLSRHISEEIAANKTDIVDTNVWAIAAIGPEKLDELGINPDRIVELAEDSRGVKVEYVRPDGQRVKIEGFDFTPERDAAKAGVVYSEGTAQMVLVFKIMANFYYKKGMIAKARSYEVKADAYLVGLGNMIIPGLSLSEQAESCVAYATQDAADTGHGWVMPRSKTSGSISGTVYTLFAYYSYNPLELDKE